MICDSCKYKQNAVVYHPYKHRNTVLYGGCRLHSKLIFNQETGKFECPLYKKEEEVKVSRNGYGHYEIIKPTKGEKNGKRKNYK